MELHGEDIALFDHGGEGRAVVAESDGDSPLRPAPHRSARNRSMRRAECLRARADGCARRSLIPTHVREFDVGGQRANPAGENAEARIARELLRWSCTEPAGRGKCRERERRDRWRRPGRRRDFARRAHAIKAEKWPTPGRIDGFGVGDAFSARRRAPDLHARRRSARSTLVTLPAPYSTKRDLHSSPLCWEERCEGACRGRRQNAGHGRKL